MVHQSLQVKYMVNVQLSFETKISYFFSGLRFYSLTWQFFITSKVLAKTSPDITHSTSPVVFLGVYFHVYNFTQTNYPNVNILDCTEKMKLEDVSCSEQYEDILHTRQRTHTHVLVTKI